MIDSNPGLSTAQVMALPPKLRLKVFRFLLRWSRWEAALPIARRLSEEQSDGLLYRSSLAQILAALGQLDEAAAIVADLQHEYPGRPYCLIASAELEMARGDLPAALKACLEMLKVREDNPEAWRRLAALYLAAGQTDKSHSYCRKIVDHYGARRSGGDEEARPHPGALRTLAEIHNAAGDAQLADEIERELVEREAREEAAMRAEIENSAATAQLIENRPYDSQEPPEDTVPVEEVPPPAPPIPPEARDCLSSVFGYGDFRTKQADVIARALAGEDQLVVMPTGAGKSLCYQLPAALGKRVAVISPLIALMKDQVDGLPPALASVATVINSTLESDELERRLSDIADGRCKLIYAAPERLRQAPFLHALARGGVDLFVVDEVHCVSIWGHDFRPDYLFIAAALQMIGNPPFLGMTATAGPPMRREIRNRVGRNLVVTSAGTYRANLVLQVRDASGDAEKLRTLIRICREETGCGIVYVNSRKKAEELASHLRIAGIDAGHYHAGMEPAERNEAQEAFMTGRTRVIVATVAFGMGVDKREVRFVVHYSLPKSVENYYQEAGRAGRDGMPSRCTLIYAPRDKAMLTTWVHASEVKIDHLKSVYQALKWLVPGGGPVHEDDLVRESGLDEKAVRVGISMLERAGLISRRLDVPMTLNLMVRKDGGPQPFQEFVEAARLRPRQRIALELSEVSERTGMSLTEIEPKLLAWRDDGLIYCKGSGRTMFVEMVHGVTGARAALEEMIAEHRAQSERKIARLGAYAKSKRCRHNFIARHFGEPHVEGCTSCDNCNGASAPRTLCEDHLLVLKSLETLPVRMDPKGLAAALSGARRCPIQPHEWPQLGAFRAKPEGYAGKVIEDLITWGYLDREGSILRQVLVLTMAARRLIHEPAE